MKKILFAVVIALALNAGAYTTNFFNVSQTATVTSSNINAVTLRSGDYLFTYSQDGYWSSYQGGTPTGRFFSVFWPTGVQAQAITAGPLVGNGANITLKRVDGKPFDLQAFTGKLLANTAGAGGAFEIMPQVNGEDAFADPLMYDATGYGGQSFPHTPALSNYDTYKIHLWVDWALTALTLIDTNPVVPPAPDMTIAASVSPVGAGTVSGAGTYPSNTTAALSALANAGWGFKNWTVNGTQVSSSANYNFTVRSNRTLVANFVPAFTVTTTALPNYAGTATGGDVFNSNTTVTVRAAPATGFQFVNWTDSGTPVSTATNFTFTITNDHSFTANYAPLPQTALFDFDTGTPAVSVYQGMPASQTQNGLTAYFTTLAGSWSMQTPQTSVIGAPPAFSGNMLYPGTWWSSFQIEFSAPITNLAFDFMTGDVSSEYNTASTVRITAHTNSAATPAVGTGTAQGAWNNGAYPDGHINFSSATPFTIVTVDIAPVGIVSGLLFVDNIVAVRAAAPANFNITTAASPAEAGNVTPGGTFPEGSLVTLNATTNIGYVFLGWLENGVPVSYTPTFDYFVYTNAALVAEFLSNSPPVAGADNFTRTQKLSLKIKLTDLLVNDYDPDGDWFDVIDVSPASTNGVPLTWDTTNVYYPATNLTGADEFAYTIMDAYGQTATGTVSVSVIVPPPGQVTSIASLTGNSATVNFAGVPGYTYVTQRSTDLVHWVNVHTNVAPAGGLFSAPDNFTDLGGGAPGSAFYRLQAQ